MTQASEGVAGATLGHGHLKVSDLDRSTEFYTKVIGMKIRQRYGSSAIFLSFGDYHHDLGLNTWESAGGEAPAKGTTGLYHMAFLYPDRKTLGQAIDRVRQAGYSLSGAADHGVSEAVYLDDPDGNGVELYRDKPRADWPSTEDGMLAMVNRPLDVEALVAEGRS